jgi:hypothetical protein
MLQACRPAGRLFYLVLALAVLSIPGSAHEDSSTGKANSFPVANRLVAEAVPRTAFTSPQSGSALTSVVDTVYMADGSDAQGILVITWPAFITASGTAVAAGVLDVTLGSNGALNVALEPNTGATPPGVYYTVVYQLEPGEVRTEYWAVPASSPATLAQVRTTPGSGTAAQPVSIQYVNTALAGKANDNAVVHLANAETITGTKSFVLPPNVPAPVGTGDVANKAYVDSSVATVGTGNYLPTAGGAMTGPLTLSGSPTAPFQASDKQYVDLSAATKADLVNGLVPAIELGSGTASALNCLLGSGTWGPCGSSANATAIQSVPVAASAPVNGQVLTYSSTSGQYSPATPSGATGGVVTGPGASQNITQPVGTQLSVNDLSGVRYVTVGDNWSVIPSGSLIGGTPATVSLTPCPVGIDTSGNSMYFVYLSGQGTPEAAMVTGGTCTSGAASGTIVFTPRNTHSATYVLSSASSGIQEAINDACGVPSGSGGNPNAHIVLPATGATGNALPVYGAIFAHCGRSLIEGNGSQLSCSTRDRCIVLGDLVNSNHYGAVTLRGVNLTSTVNSDGCQITNTQRQSNVVTITVAAGCSTIQTGDLVNINFTDVPNYWGSHGPVTVSGSLITYSQTAANLAAVASPGTIAIQNAAVEDNALPGTMEDIKYSVSGGGKFNQFFVVDNDQAATIRNFDNGGQGILCTANHCGSFIYSAGTTAATPVLWLDKLNISAQCGGNGVTNYANNGTHITDSVIQGFGMWGIYTSTILGSYGGTQVDNVYNEEGAGPCPNPYLGSTFGSAGIIYSSGGSPLVIRGGEQPNGWMPIFASTGSTQYNYYVVVHDATEGVSYPLYAGYALTNGSGNIAVQWPHVAPVGSVTYDLVRMVPGTLASNGPTFPVQGACGGGNAAACGSVATNLAQCSGLVCSYTDSASASTSNYAMATPGYFPALTFWPGGMVLNGNGLQNAGSLSSAIIDTDAGSTNSSAWISMAGFLRPTIYARQCSGSAQVPYGGAWMQCLELDSHGNGFAEVGATLLNNGPNTGSQFANVKGRLNFEMSPGATGLEPQHIITLVDSNPAKTLATSQFRPSNDANDTYIGLDNGNVVRSLAQLAFGAPAAISSYIGNTGDNASYLERLTAAAKTFNVPVTINGNLTVTGTCTGCGGGGGGSGTGTVNSGTSTQVAMYAGTGTAVSGDAALTDTGSTLNYTGSSGISAAAGTFSGNLTVNGQLLVAGPWLVNTPIPGTAMAAAGAGTSALGISNDGNFYISANAGTPQKVATAASSSYFSNLFQEDANDIGEYGSVAQNLHVYSSYTNSSTWQRTSVGFDLADNYAVIRSESSSAGAAPGLGLWINNGLKWVVDASGNFKPWTDQTYNVGSFSGSGGSGLRPGTVYVAGNSTSGSGFELGKFANESYELCNDATNGTIVNGLAVLTGAGCAGKPSSALTSGAIGVVIANAGTSGVVTLARSGSAFCSFDASTTVIGDYVVPSSTASSGFFPLCHDAGATRPTGTQILGRVLQASSGSATVQMFLDMPGSNVSASGGGAGTGSCTNQAVTAVLGGGPTCTTITSAYVDSSVATTASPALTGTPTVPTASTSTNSTQAASTAYVQNNLANYQTTTAAQGAYSGTGSCTNKVVTTNNANAAPTCTTVTSSYVDSTIAPSASPTLTGTPTAPTAAANTNTTQVATTAFVLGQASSTTPNVDGTAAVGVSNTFARADHVHPTDSSRAPLASPGLTGTPTAPTATSGDNSTKISTTAYVRSEIYMAWTCAVAGTTAVSQYCNWTVPAGLTVTGFDLAASTAAAGCTTYPVLQVWDGTSGAELGSYSTVFTSGTNFYTQVTGSTNLSSGHQLRLKITTAAAGCTTNAAGIVATVTYQMQN